MNFSQKDAWRNIKILNDGFTAHHLINNPMIFSRADGSITKNDREMIEVLVKHFTKVHNRSVYVDGEFVKSITCHSVFHGIAGLMTLSELDEALFCLTWHKAPGSIVFPQMELKL